MISPLSSNKNSLKVQPATQIQFKMLTKTEQVVSVLQDGKPYGQRSISGYSVRLFLLGDSFVELWYAGKDIEKVKQLSERTAKRLYGNVPAL